MCFLQKSLHFVHKPIYTYVRLLLWFEFSAKHLIKIYILSRANLLLTVWDEIPCNSKQSIHFHDQTRKDSQENNDEKKFDEKDLVLANIIGIENNPWAVKTLDDFCFFLYPECDFKGKDRATFHNHAMNAHQKVNSFILSKYICRSNKIFKPCLNYIFFTKYILNQFDWLDTQYIFTL